VVIAASMDELCLCPGMGEKGLLLTSWCLS
jgi:hypothetical protein